MTGTEKKENGPRRERKTLERRGKKRKVGPYSIGEKRDRREEEKGRFARLFERGETALQKRHSSRSRKKKGTAFRTPPLKTEKKKKLFGAFGEVKARGNSTRRKGKTTGVAPTKEKKKSPSLRYGEEKKKTPRTTKEKQEEVPPRGKKRIVREKNGSSLTQKKRKGEKNQPERAASKKKKLPEKEGKKQGCPGKKTPSSLSKIKRKKRSPNEDQGKKESRPAFSQKGGREKGAHEKGFF